MRASGYHSRAFCPSRPSCGGAARALYAPGRTAIAVVLTAVLLANTAVADITRRRPVR
ncbi:hypothetical protein OG883_21245 [Streptomyces sp. NBC_01142]|uniref:hypothetical protein n=1 Tax=Streptomyces sp. NBC_01142 TaxID=2975865 RepID=UPI002256964B|nr:hypothetical protein [Streptomyces sp. NBC_01142]MCX4822368.1 hypothetical protein [Streptomyces sp. NBC_01142]